ncbi:4Fe-4S binding protein [Caldicellulosiruptoraceae bacterium PP1]
MNKSLRKNITQILRFTVQIISLIFFSGMFVYIFAGIEQLFKYLIKGNIPFTSVSTYFATLFITFIITILLGRFFCGWICSFGTVFSYLNKIVKKVFKIKININEKIDNYLKYSKYIILFLIALFIWTLNYNILKSFSPWDAFSELIALSSGVISYKGGLLILSFIFIISIFVERAFCRYFCPLGALFSITSKLRILRIRKKNNNCGNCMICTNECEMGLPLNRLDEVKSGECLNCFRCVSSCPRHNQEVVVFNQPINKNLAGAVTVASLLGVYTLMNTVSLNAENHISVSQQQIVVDNSSSTQTIQNNNQDSNTTTSDSHNSTTKSDETQNSNTSNDSINKSNGGITNNSNNSASQQIIQNNNQVSNTTTSDSHNTATKSNETQNSNNSNDSINKSNGGITDNSNNTVSQQITQYSNQINNTTTSDSQNTTISNEAQNSNTSNENNSVTNSTRIYKDGTYTGEGIGYRPGIVVEVTIKDDKITKIEIVSDNETPRFSYLPFQTVPQEIIDSQSTKVDTVSGATMSSEGIIMAVEDALSKARINQN